MIQRFLLAVSTSAIGTVALNFLLVPMYIRCPPWPCWMFFRTCRCYHQ